MVEARSTDSETGRERILGRAAELFLTRGYAETSLRTIADAVEMRPASIYHHFESKDALLSEILEIGMDSVTSAFNEVSEALSPAATGIERLAAHVAGHLDALFTNHAFTATHVTVFPFVPDEVRSAAIAQRDGYESMWAELLADIAPGLTTEGLRYARLALFGAMNSAVQWFDPESGSTEDLSEAIVNTLWNGLGASS